MWLVVDGRRWRRTDPAIPADDARPPEVAPRARPIGRTDRGHRRRAGGHPASDPAGQGRARRARHALVGAERRRAAGALGVGAGRARRPRRVGARTEVIRTGLRERARSAVGGTSVRASPRWHAREVTDPEHDQAPQPSAEGLAEPMRSRWSSSVYDDRHRLSRRRDRDPAARRAVGAERRQQPAVVVLRVRAGHDQPRPAGRDTEPGQLRLGAAGLGRLPHRRARAHRRGARRAGVQRLRDVRRRPGRGPPHPAGTGDGTARPPVRRVRPRRPRRRAGRTSRPTSCSPASRSARRATRRRSTSVRRPATTATGCASRSRSGRSGEGSVKDGWQTRRS